jgi:hypothetical protein
VFYIPPKGQPSEAAKQEARLQDAMVRAERRVATKPFNEAMVLSDRLIMRFAIEEYASLVREESNGT